MQGFPQFAVGENGEAGRRHIKTAASSEAGPKLIDDPLRALVLEKFHFVTGLRAGYGDWATTASRMVKIWQSLPNGVAAGESGEGSVTKQIENVTSKIPSATFLSLALASIGLSALLQVSGRKNDAQFVGQWVPTILTLGLYNKLVKLQGSE